MAPDPSAEPVSSSGNPSQGGDRTACGHSTAAFSVRFATPDVLSGDVFSLARCATCGIGATTPQPSAGSLARYYPAPYHGTPGKARFPWFVERLQAVLYRARARAVEAALPDFDARRASVLDIGCGRGGQLEAFRKRGWTVLGTELSERTAVHAREALGLEVRVGPIASLRAEACRFDAVILWHVLEHLPEPDEALTEIRQLLRPGGVLLVGVPNLDSPEARLAGEHWFHLDVPRHLWHFTPASLARLLRGAGFQDERWRWFAPEFDLFSFIQSTENRLGLPRNMLYSTLRGRESKLLHGRSFGWAWLALLLAIPLGLFGLPVVWVAGWLKAGSSMTVLARVPDAGAPRPATG